MPPTLKRKKSAPGSRTAKARGATIRNGQAVETNRAHRQPTVVGLGASAGGLEALKAFFGAMPPRTGLAFVVVVHLDPTHESLIPELLSHVTALTVEQARDNRPSKRITCTSFRRTDC
jgi:two-component system CheB/CheR fusion protein